MEKDLERAEPEYVQEMWEDEGEPVSNSLRSLITSLCIGPGETVRVGAEIIGSKDKATYCI